MGVRKHSLVPTAGPEHNSGVIFLEEFAAVSEILEPQVLESALGLEKE